MNSLSASLQVNDNLSPMLSQVNGALTGLQANFQRFKASVSAGTNTASWKATEQGIILSASALKDYNKTLEQTRQAEKQKAAASEWKRVNPEVVKSKGTERFIAESQLANQAAQRLYQNQQKISQKAERMEIIPPGMLNDVVSVNNRIQSLQSKVSQLNQIPLKLRTDQVNNDIEKLRGSLADIEIVQKKLDDSIAQMDFAAINEGYQQLNQLADGADRNIRNRLEVQDPQPEKDGIGNPFFDRIAEFGSRAFPVIKTAAKDMAVTMYEAAVELEATEARYHAAFGGMSGEADRFIKDFQRLTPATTAEARNMAIGLQELLAPMGLQGESAAQMTGSYMQLVGALSNFYSSTKSAEDVAGAFQAAIASEYGALKELGIHVNESMADQQAVNMGLAQNTSEVSDAARAQAVLSLAYGQSQSALASYNETSLSTKNRMDIVKKGFQDAFAQAGQALLPHISELLMQIQARMPQITAALSIFAGIFSECFVVGSEALQMLMDIGGVIMDHWSLIGPVIAGVTAAMLTYKGIVIAYNAVQTISNGLQAVAAANAALKAGADGVGAAATGVLTAAQMGFNAALLACPLTWIIIIIAAVVAAIVVWVQHVGGIKVAWLMMVHALLTGADLLKLAFTMWVNHNKNQLDNFLLFMNRVKVGFLKVFGDIKVMGLNFVQDLLNGAISMINRFITAVNSIAGTSISLVDEVTFATTAAAKEKAKQKQREKELSVLENRLNWDKGIRTMKENVQILELKNNSAMRQAEIDRLRAENKNAAQENGGLNLGDGYNWGQDPNPVPGSNPVPGYNPGDGYNGYNEDVAYNTGGTAANTAAMADTMGIMEEDIKYMRDAAEQEIINRFTLAELKLDINNNNTLTTKTDFEEMTRRMTDFTGEFLAVAAEGGYA